MNYINTMVRNRGFQMPNDEAKKPAKTSRRHGFVPAEEYLRELGLKASLRDLAYAHARDSKRSDVSHYAAVEAFTMHEPIQKWIAELAALRLT